MTQCCTLSLNLHNRSLMLALTLLKALIFAATPAYAMLDDAATRGSVGDIPNHGIAGNGFTIDVMNNDFLGGTDKYMTGAMKAGLLRTWGDAGKGYTSSCEFTINWRALTPTESETVGGKPLLHKVGRFADWMESELSYARTYPLANGYRIKGQLAMGVGHIGSKGMREMHVAIHKAIGMQFSGLNYDNQPLGRTFKHDAFTGIIKPFSSDMELMLGIGHAKDMATTDVYQQTNFYWRLQKHYQMGAEARIVRQFGSEIYDELATWRMEASIAMTVYKYYQPSFKYVSNYMGGDPRGQVYPSVA